MNVTEGGKVEPPARPHLIVVDDDDGVRRSLQLMLHWRGYDVHSFAAAEPVLADPRALEAALLVVDQSLPDGDGISLMATLRERGWRGRAVMITGSSTPGLVEEAGRHGCTTVLEKPLRNFELLMALGNQMANDI
jgi:FixJ family two-component response regulator